ncbi:isocitrate lyase/phosphoenolpyruvate mutase family protein [Spongiactinospora sp. TRM90649]|uniref:isocitrate lyase/PEP mutase family protein n=1 Tax=Spongiactinospora sp. TRM90649 TaxID=3031114 RepID=UPI0023F720E0|nr:isocitrate lyase/phosphoenolpyruvate mutase family protein [Spongiactinospora sp. TRM90649]MDF5759242.1 isocitrate lyase/phosphoenolpyruvate mutase family protein [Spongiactinospora sp. TRM90649]
MSFRELHHAQGPLLLPNAWDYTSGAALVRAGFPAVGTTSLGVAAGAGKPDSAGGTQAETLTLARALVRLPVPVTVDAEGGFSDDPGEVAALVAELAALGVAGVNIEDGRPGGSLVPVAHQTQVVAAVRSAAPEIFINARTDTFWLSGDREPSIDETLTRARAYADAGADGVFVPGAARDEDVSALVAGVPVPLNILFLPGRTDRVRLAELGVRRISLGSLLYRTALGAAVAAATEIFGGTPGPQVPTYAQVEELLEDPSPR